MYSPFLPPSPVVMQLSTALQVSEKSIARQLQFILDQIECEVRDL
jgi:hypothetical protein